jgi:hypothetical protein
MQVVYEGTRSSRVRKLHVMSHMSPHVDLRTHNHDIINLDRALRERVFYVKDGDGFKLTPLPSVNVSATLRRFKAELLAHCQFSLPTTHENFIAHCPSFKRRLYLRASLSLKTKPVCREDAVIKAFVKAEKTNFSAKWDPAPRVIQPRDPRYNIEVGVFLKLYEKRLLKNIDRVYGWPTVMKGYTALECGDVIHQHWCHFSDPVAVGIDASRFDQHVSSDMLRWEHSIYNAIFHDAKLAELLSWQIDNVGVGYCPEGKIRYSVNGKRASGDMNTSLGNCIIMCGIFYTWMIAVSGQNRVRFINNGDDCVVFMERRDLPLLDGFDTFCLSLGFEMEIEKPVDKLELVKFCQTSPVYTVNGYVMCRDPRVCLAKDSSTLLPMDHPTLYDQFCWSIGSGGFATYGNMPVLGAFYACLARSSKHKKPLRDARFLDSIAYTFAWDHKKSCVGSVHWRTRVSFYHAFGITPDIQCEVERYFDGLDMQYLITEEFESMQSWF